VQVTCFQSINQSPEGEAPQFIRLEVPLHIKPTESLSKLCLQVKYMFYSVPDIKMLYQIPAHCTV